MTTDSLLKFCDLLDGSNYKMRERGLRNREVEVCICVEGYSKASVLE